MCGYKNSRLFVARQRIYFFAGAFFAAAFFLPAFLTGFLAAFAAGFLAAAAGFLAAGFLAAGFLAFFGVFFAAGFLAFFAAGFLAFFTAGFFAATFFLGFFGFSASLKDPEAPVPLTCFNCPEATPLLSANLQ